ncbi:EscU/YscU/HrcU family type III secretion system export apparatus switch protein [Natranaerobius trueperi]|uniref:FhlB domain-containing protein n=1 Tax=Natranaerobius trueperi TaxID=759412 RepID=A0A226C0W9_9FIRM|nr:EscU/YscU/HrcU family type III secretion system export apparatus switch protein [Natranaerobius trueperi]OWZ84948.1 FhlB domain-containing protein [Natranaerobius trueperi]
MSNKTNKATALKYDPDKNLAPQIVASGDGYIADEIIKIAEHEGVFIHKDPKLINTLSKLNLYQEIPEELYQGVAEILAFIHKLETQSSLSEE